MMPSWIWKPITAGLGLGLVVVGLRVVSQLLPARAHASDFSQVYATAHAMSQGLNPYDVALDQYSADHGFGFSGIISQATNPPLLAWVLQPLGWFTPATAFRISVTIELLALVAVVVLAVRLLSRPLTPHGICLAVGLLCCSMPVFAHFWFSQVQLLLLALVLAGALALRAGRGWLACVLWGLATALKFYPAPLLALPALLTRGRKRWELAGVAGLSLFGWAVLPGWQAWESFFHRGLPLLKTWGNGRYYNFTVTSAVMDLWRPAAGTEWLPAAVPLVVSAALVAVAWLICSRPGIRPDDALSLLLVTSVMCSPIAWVHYLVWLFYPCCVLASRRRWVLLVVAVVCFNAAGSNPLEVTSRAARFLNGSLPLLVMIGLYIYFASRREDPV